MSKYNDLLRGFPAAKVARVAGVSRASLYNYASGKNGGAPFCGPKIDAAIERLVKERTKKEILKKSQYDS